MHKKKKTSSMGETHSSFQTQETEELHKHVCRLSLCMRGKSIEAMATLVAAQQRDEEAENAVEK